MFWQMLEFTNDFFAHPEQVFIPYTANILQEKTPVSG